MQHTAKSDLKNERGVNFAKKSDLASLKLDVDKLDIDILEKVPNDLRCLKITVDKLAVDKLVHVAVDLSKLSDLVKKMLKRLNIMNWLKI